MTPDIEPLAFTHLMLLPQGDRRDLLEFLGATAFARAVTERIITEVEAHRHADGAPADDPPIIEH